MNDADVTAQLAEALTAEEWARSSAPVANGHRWPCTRFYVTADDSYPCTCPATPAVTLGIAAALLSVVQQYGDQRAAEALDAAYWATAAITDPEAVREVILARAAALRGAGR
jgi:hypothetical protein